MSVEVSVEQFIEQISSFFLETKRVPDPYYYFVSSSGELLSPTARCNVKDSISRDTFIEELEYQALLAVENWAANNNEGIIAWVSPPSPGLYSVSKVIISELQQQDGVKTLFNRAIVLDINEAECVKFVQDLANYCVGSPLFTSSDQIRSTPLVLKTPGNHWTYVLEELITGFSLESVRSGEDQKIKKETLLQAGEIYRKLLTQNGGIGTEMIFDEAERQGLVGDYDPSCPLIKGGLSAFAAVFGNALRVETNKTCKKIKCQKCPWEASNDEAQKVAKGEITCCPKCGWKPG